MLSAIAAARLLLADRLERVGRSAGGDTERANQHAASHARRREAMSGSSRGKHRPNIEQRARRRPRALALRSPRCPAHCSNSVGRGSSPPVRSCSCSCRRSIQIRSPGDWDPRPLGSAEDIAALRKRSDLNVLFVLVDTLRADRLGSYGYAAGHEPRARPSGRERRALRAPPRPVVVDQGLDGLAVDGSLPARNGITRFDQVIPDAARMPAEILREAGFQTVGLYRNGWVAPTFGFDQGFEVYEQPDRARSRRTSSGRIRRSPTRAPTRARSRPRWSSCGCAAASAGSCTCT